jgi:rod shape-determining protein MreD
MKLVNLAAGLVLALLLRTVFSQLIHPGFALVDGFLLLAVYYGMRYGKGWGMGIGLLTGLVQDGMSGGIFGVEAFSRALLGFASGSLAEGLLLRDLVSWFLLAAGAYAANTVIVAVLLMIVQETPPGSALSPVPLLGTALLNGLLGAVLFHLIYRRSTAVGGTRRHYRS